MGSEEPGAFFKTNFTGATGSKQLNWPAQKYTNKFDIYDRNLN